MGESMRDHVEKLGRHGAYVKTLAGKRPLSGAFYDSVIRLCEQYGINCIGYEIELPGVDHAMIAIWRNGHVDSGSADNIRAIMNQ